MAQNETWLNHDMMNAVKVQYLDGNVFSMDNAGNLIGVVLTKGGVAYSGGGTVSANVIRADGATVSVSGALSGNLATVVLPQAAYAVPGVLSVIIKLTLSGEITTIGAVVANVYQSSTDTVVDPGTIIPSIETLIAEIETVVASIPSDYSSLWTSLAPIFSTSTNYMSGQYVTYNGTLYRFITDHSTGSWNYAHVVETNLGDGISALIIGKMGEVDFTGITNAISRPLEKQVRFAKLSPIYGGQIKSLFFKVQMSTSTNTRVWIGELVDGNYIKLAKTFTLYTVSTKTEYINGVDFTLDYEVGPNSVIGFSTPVDSGIGYFGGTNGSYIVSESGYEEGGTYPAELKSYGVSIGAILPSPIIAQTKPIRDELELLNKKLLAGYAFGETDLSSMTSEISRPETRQVRFSKIASEIGGKIKEIRFKSNLNGNIRFWIGEIINDGYIKLAKTFIFPASTSKTEYINGTDFNLDYEVGPNSVIGFNIPIDSGIGYFGGTNGSYIVSESGYEEGGTYPAELKSYGVSIGATIEAIIEGIETEVENHDNEIAELNEQIQSIISTGIIRYGKKIPSSTDIYVDSDIIHARVKYVSANDSEVKLNRTQNDGSSVCRTDFVNFESGKIGFYAAHAYNVSPTVYKEYTPGFSFVVNHEYDIFSIRYLGYIYQLTITDAWTQETYTATEIDAVNTIGAGWGKRSVTSGTGATIINNDNYMLQPYENRMCFIGDSYIEGNSIADNKEKRYAALTFERLKGDVFIWGQGGASSSSGVAWLPTVMGLSVSDYYMIPFGMNDSNYTTWKNNIDSMIATIVSAGKTPVLATIPPVSGVLTNEVHMQMNEYIRSLNYKYIDVAKLLSQGHNGTTPDDSMMLPDHVHPTIESHELIYKLIVSTIPEIFGTAIEQNEQ